MEYIPAALTLLAILSAGAIKYYGLLSYLTPDALLGIEIPNLSKSAKKKSHGNKNNSCSPEAKDIQKIEYNFYVLDDESNIQSIIHPPNSELPPPEDD